MSSCQPVDDSRLAGAGKCFVSTTPTENETFAATAAPTPMGSMSAPGRMTTSATPIAAIAPTTRSRIRTARRAMIHDNDATVIGCSPPTAAATPPGSR